MAERKADKAERGLCRFCIFWPGKTQIEKGINLNLAVDRSFQVMAMINKDILCYLILSPYGAVFEAHGLNSGM